MFEFIRKILEGQELSTEEKEAIEAFEANYIPGHEELNQNIPEDPLRLAQTQYQELFNNQSILDSPVELVFTVSCSTFVKDNMGNINAVGGEIEKNYHIPLNNKSQAESCSARFFEKLNTMINESVSENFKKETEDQNESN